MRIFHLCHRRMRRTIGTNQTIAKEITITRGIHSEIASISIEQFSIFIPLGQSLIYPVPNETTLQIRVFIDCLPLPPQVTCRITHGMSILRRHDRTITAFTTNLLQPIRTRILRHVHVRIPFPKSTLVANRTIHASFLSSLNIKVSLIEIVTISGLITQRPNRHARVILVALIHINCPVHMRFQPFRVVSQRTTTLQVVIHSVRLNVGFVINI